MEPAVESPIRGVGRNELSAAWLGRRLALQLAPVEKLLKEHSEHHGLYPPLSALTGSAVRYHVSGQYRLRLVTHILRTERGDAAVVQPYEPGDTTRIALLDRLSGTNSLEESGGGEEGRQEMAALFELYSEHGDSLPPSLPAQVLSAPARREVCLEWLKEGAAGEGEEALKLRLPDLVRALRRRMTALQQGGAPQKPANQPGRSGAPQQQPQQQGERGSGGGGGGGAASRVEGMAMGRSSGGGGGGGAARKPEERARERSVGGGGGGGSGAASKPEERARERGGGGGSRAASKPEERAEERRLSDPRPAAGRSRERSPRPRSSDRNREARSSDRRREAPPQRQASPPGRRRSPARDAAPASNGPSMALPMARASSPALQKASASGNDVRPEPAQHKGSQRADQQRQAAQQQAERPRSPGGAEPAAAPAAAAPPADTPEAAALLPETETPSFIPLPGDLSPLKRAAAPSETAQQPAGTAAAAAAAVAAAAAAAPQPEQPPNLPPGFGGAAASPPEQQQPAAAAASGRSGQPEPVGGGGTAGGGSGRRKRPIAWQEQEKQEGDVPLLTPAAAKLAAAATPVEAPPLGPQPAAKKAKAGAAPAAAGPSGSPPGSYLKPRPAPTAAPAVPPPQQQQQTTVLVVPRPAKPAERTLVVTVKNKAALPPASPPMSALRPAPAGGGGGGLPALPPGFDAPVPGLVPPREVTQTLDGSLRVTVAAKAAASPAEGRVVGLLSASKGPLAARFAGAGPPDSPDPYHYIDGGEAEEGGAGGVQLTVQLPGPAAHALLGYRAVGGGGDDAMDEGQPEGGLEEDLGGAVAGQYMPYGGLQYAGAGGQYNEQYAGQYGDDGLDVELDYGEDEDEQYGEQYEDDEQYAQQHGEQHPAGGQGGAALALPGGGRRVVVVEGAPGGAPPPAHQAGVRMPGEVTDGEGGGLFWDPFWVWERAVVSYLRRHPAAELAAIQARFPLPSPIPGTLDHVKTYMDARPSLFDLDRAPGPGEGHVAYAVHGALKFLEVKRGLLSALSAAPRCRMHARQAARAVRGGKLPPVLAEQLAADPATFFKRHMSDCVWVLYSKFQKAHFLELRGMEGLGQRFKRHCKFFKGPPGSCKHEELCNFAHAKPRSYLG